MKRIESKKIYLIYEDIPLETSNEIFINNLKNEIKIDNYIICNDVNNKNLKNIHIFIENQNKIRNIINKFNLKINNNLYLYEEINTKISNKKKLIDNLLKKKDVINNFNTIISKEFHSEKDYLLNLAKKTTPNEIEAILIEEFPKLYLNKGSTLLNTLKTISKHYNNEDYNIVQTQFKLSQFNINNNLQQQFNNWDPNQRSLIVHGLSGSGKTNYMLSLLESKNRRVLFVTHKEDLAKFDSKLHDTILFDDVNFFSQFKTKEEIISIVDVLFPRTFKVLYQAINIPQGTWKIFTTNEDPLFPFENYLEIQRRILKIKIDHHLYKNNIQINNNIQLNQLNNYIFNNNKDKNIIDIK